MNGLRLINRPFFSYKISTPNQFCLSSSCNMELTVAIVVVVLAGLARSDYTDPQWKAGSFLNKISGNLC